ncbi:MAG TPA: helix-turn-helix transcriptional regulator [bacterium]|nr:helix-turn-helix transcriptional regulator [bacterium]
MKFDRELMKGHLKIIILAALDDGPGHGYALIQRIRERSQDIFSLTRGTLYPALHKLEAQGLVVSIVEKPEKGPARRVYSLTVKGRKILIEHKRDWDYFSLGMNTLLKTR